MFRSRGIRKIGSLLSAYTEVWSAYLNRLRNPVVVLVIRNVWEHSTTPSVGALYAAYVDLRVSDDELADAS